VVAVVEADLDLAACRGGSCCDRARFAHVAAHRLLQQHVLPGAERCDRDLGEEAVRRGHAHDVDVVGGNDVVPIEADPRPNIFGKLRCDADVTVGDGDAARRFVTRRFYRSAAPNKAATDDAYAEHRHAANRDPTPCKPKSSYRKR
jgi:hypothetical protein